MILADSSAWFEFLRATNSPVCARLRGLLATPEELATTDPVVMEVLAGARDDSHEESLRRLLGRATFLAVEGPGDYEVAAALYRTCRRSGETVRALIDCLIGAVGIRCNAAILASDRDFEVLGRHAGVPVASR